jgi:hypothetical protein
MVEILRAQRLVGTIPRPDRIGGEVEIFAIFHAFYDPDGFLGMLGYWGASDGSAYPLPDELSRFEVAACAERSVKRAQFAAIEWIHEVAVSLSALNARLARGEIEMPEEAVAS